MTCELAAAYLEEGAVEELLPSPDDGVLVLVLPLQGLGQALHQGGQRTACKTLEQGGRRGVLGGDTHTKKKNM